MVRVHKMGYFNIYSDKKGHYIVHNTRKEFKDGHTHIDNYKTAKFICSTVLNKRIPEAKIGKYLIISLVRVSDSKTYKRKLKNKFYDLIGDDEI